MTDEHELHNETAAQAVGVILCPAVVAKPDPTLALVVLESVIVGVLSVTCKPGIEEEMFVALIEGVRERLAKIREKNGSQNR